MPNIFENEKKEEKLVKDRKVKPVKGQAPSPNKTPQASEPVQAQNEGLLPQEPPAPPAQPPMEMPLLFRDGFNPAPVVPPTGYGQISGQAFAGSRTNELIQAESIQRVEPQNTQPLESFLMGNVYREPPTQIDPKIQTHSNNVASTDFIKARESWKKFIVPPKVGLSEGTSFKTDGTLDRQVPAEEITRGIHGLQSDLGKAFEQRFDKDGFWGRNLRRVGGFFQYGKNAMDMINNKIMDNDAPWFVKFFTELSPANVGQEIGKLIFSGDEEIMSKHEEYVKEIEREFVGKTLPDFTNSERSMGYELQKPTTPEIGEFGRAGVLSLGAYLLNLPENIVSGALYEFADEYKRQVEQNRQIKSPILRQAMNAVSVLSSAGQASLDLTIGTVTEAADELIRGSTPEGDNRIVQVLKGKNMSLANRWSERDFLGVQEPDDLPLGELTGNLWWDLPENIHNNLQKIGIKSDLRALHWATQGVVATALELFLDAPIDSGIDALKGLGKAAELTDVFGDTGRVISNGLVEPITDLNVKQPMSLLPDVPVVRVPNKTSVVPNETRALIPAKAGSPTRLEITSPDLVDNTVLNVSQLPPINKVMDDPTYFEVSVKAEDFIPNVNRSQSLIVQMSDPLNAKPLYTDLPVVDRNLDELSSVAKSLVDENGEALIPANHTLSKAELSVLMEQYPDEFSRFGKQVNLQVPFANRVSAEITSKPAYLDLPPSTVTKGDTFLKDYSVLFTLDEVQYHNFGNGATGDVLMMVEEWANVNRADLNELWDTFEINLTSNPFYSDATKGSESYRLAKELTESRPQNMGEFVETYESITGRDYYDDVFRAEGGDIGGGWEVKGTTDLLPVNPSIFEANYQPGKLSKRRGYHIRVGKGLAEYDETGYRVSKLRPREDMVEEQAKVLSSVLDEVEVIGDSVRISDELRSVKVPTETLNSLNQTLSESLGFEVHLMKGYTYGDLVDRVEYVLRQQDTIRDVLSRNGASAWVEAHGYERYGDVWRLGETAAPWQHVVDDTFPKGSKCVVSSCSGSESFGLGYIDNIDTWEIMESGALTRKSRKDLSIMNTGLDPATPPKQMPEPSVPSLKQNLEGFQNKVKEGVWSNSELTKLRLQEASIPAEEYYQQLAKLPRELKGLSPKSISTGGQYVESMRNLKYHGLTLADIQRNVEDLEAVSRSIKSRLDTIGHIGRGDINVELGTKQALGDIDDYLQRPKFTEPEVFDVNTANADALDELARGTPNLPVLERMPSQTWKHGTSHKTDIRGYVPENGSGSHELGIGVYFTQNDEVAKAHALAFGHSNVPDSILDDLGTPNVKSVDTTRLRNVLDLNASPTKRQFQELYMEGFAGSPAEFTSFWKYHQKHGARFADVNDNLRKWWFEKYGSSMPESMVRDFQLASYKKVKEMGVDGGILVGANGERMLVVYNPERLVNVDVTPINVDTKDLVATSLEARRFADTHTYSMLPDDYTDYMRLKSTDEVTNYLKQNYSEAYAKAYLEQSDELDNLIRLRTELADEVAKEQAQQLDSFSPSEKAEELLEKEFENKTTEVGEILNKNERYRKYRHEYEKELRKIEDKLLNSKLGDSAKRKLQARREALINAATEVDERVEHLAQIVRSLHPDEPVGSKNRRALEGLRSILKSHRQQTLNPKWYTRSGAYARRTAFEKMKQRFQRAASEYLDPMLGGDFGKIQEELVRLRRLGKGEFAYKISLMEADKVIAQVHDNVSDILSKFDLTQAQKHELITNLAELQSSPYLLDETLRANTNTGKFLASQLQEKFLRYHEEFNIPISVLTQVAEEVKRIPDVYHEVHHIIDSVGLSIGDEVTLGYMPRLKTRSAEYALSAKEGRRLGTTSETFNKSRRTFNYVVEDSMILDDYIEKVSPSFFKEVSEISGKEVHSVEDIIGEDNLLEYAFIGKLSDNDLDALNEMGVLRKVPFTSDKVAEYLIGKYELPFSGLNDVFVQDPRRAFQMYKKGLEEYLGKSGMVYSVGKDSAWTVSREFIDALPEADREIYKGWVTLNEVVSDDIKGILNTGAWESVKDVQVHPMVADLLEAQIKIQTSPFQLGVVGNMVNSLTRFLQGSMLFTLQFGVNNILGNGGSLLARGINPAGAYARYFTLGLKGLDETLPNTVKGFCNGKYTAKELWQQALKKGLVESETMIGASRPLVYKGQAKDSMMRSFAEFMNFAKNGGVNSNYASGLVDRFLDGAASVQDHTMMKYIGWVNKLTDNAYKMALLDAVTQDKFTPVAKLGRYFSEVPHFDDIEEAFKWVERNAYMFDDVAQNENLGRLLVPFWTWQRKAFFNTTKFVADHPARFGSYLKLVNGIRNDFEEDNQEAWNALQMNGWMRGDSMIPLKIDQSISASGENEYYVFPLGQLVPQMEITTVLEAFNPVKPSEPVHANETNKFSVDRNGLKSFIINRGSPMVKGVLALIDPDYLYDYTIEGSAADELRDEYPFGMNKKAYQSLKLYGRPLYNAWKMLPESVVGRAPSMNYKTGEYDEGVPSMFTGERPHWTKYNQKTPFGREGFGGLVTAFLDLAGKNPYHIDVLISQDRTVSEINSQLYDIKDEVSRLRSRLSNTSAENKDQYQRIFEAYEEMKLTYIFLKAEKDIYDEWRRLNNLPTADAVRKIKKQNIKVDMMLPKEERDRIYKENFETWYNQM